MTDKIKHVSDEEYQEYVESLTGSKEKVEVVQSNGLFADEFAPDGNKTICVVELAKAVFEKARQEITTPSFQKWVSQIDRILGRCDDFARPQRRNFDMIKQHYCDFENDQESLKVVAVDIEEVEKALQKIRQRVLRSNKKFYFMPVKYEYAARDGNVYTNGCFLGIRIADHFKYNFLPLILGLEVGKEYILAACPECARDRFNIFGLSNIRLKIRQKDRRYGFDLCSLKTYEDAQAHLNKLRERISNVGRKPEEIPPEQITSCSCFVLSFDRLDSELIAKVREYETEEKIRNAVVRHLQCLSAEEIREMKVIMGENRGDKEEGKAISQDGDQGKGKGLGPFGGKPEDKESSKYNLESKLSKALLIRANQNPEQHRILRGALREFEGESGFEIEVLLYELACFTIKSRNGNGFHRNYLFLAKIKNQYDNGQTLPVRERNEMNPNQIKFWIPIAELLQRPIGGSEARPDYHLPYYSTLKKMVWLIRRYNLAVFKELLDCENRLEKLTRK